jgi:CubicO group peptidase (beta-lactamase class C family)
MNRKRVLPALLVCFCWSITARSQELSKVSRPEDNGFSTERLERVTTFFQRAVDTKAIPGAVVAVARNGKSVYLHALGFQDRENNIPMRTDSIFRIASMTKPISSVAAMMLAEEGKIDLLAPVYQYLPEFKDVKVGAEKNDPATNKLTLLLDAPHRPMTVQDLLRHTSGLVYGPFGHTLVHQMYNNPDLFDRNQNLAEFVTKVSKLPLAHQPGTAWEYGMSIDVLGRIVEVVSGVPFDQFVGERITRPLKMNDTAFYLDAKQLSRLAELQVDATGKRPGGTPAEHLTKEKMKWFSGGGGLLSTAPDYARFCQLLLNGGEFDGVRLLSPKTISIMTSDQLSSALPRVGGHEDLAPTLELGQSFGLGFAVRTSPGPNPLPGSVGDYFWAGIYGSYFWVDPQEKMYAVLMVQMPFEESGYYRRALRELVYAARIH